MSVGAVRLKRLWAVLPALLLFRCAPLIGLDENYYVRGEGGVSAGGTAPGGTAGSSGTVSVSGGEGGASTAHVSGAGGQPLGSAGDGGAAGALPSLEVPAGKLVYHSYTSYTAGDSEMYVVTFPGGAKSAELGTEYGLCHPLNGIFSPDGKSLAVTAMPKPGVDCPTMLIRPELEVWILDLESPGQKVRVTDNGVADEDAQFSPGGDYLIFKHDDHLARWELGSEIFVDCLALPVGGFCFSRTGVQQSKPAIYPDESLVCYHDWYGPDADVLCADLSEALTGADLTEISMPVAIRGSISEARPTIGYDDFIYYVRWRGPTEAAIDEIARKPLLDFENVVEEKAEFAQDVAVHFSDPFALGNDVLIFASDVTGAGKHDLFIAEFESAEVHSLSEWVGGVNSSREELGPVFWIAP